MTDKMATPKHSEETDDERRDRVDFHRKIAEIAAEIRPKTVKDAPAVSQFAGEIAGRIIENRRLDANDFPDISRIILSALSEREEAFTKMLEALKEIRQLPHGSLRIRLLAQIAIAKAEPEIGE